MSWTNLANSINASINPIEHIVFSVNCLCSGFVRTIGCGFNVWDSEIIELFMGNSMAYLPTEAFQELQGIAVSKKKTGGYNNVQHFAAQVFCWKCEMASVQIWYVTHTWYDFRIFLLDAQDNHLIWQHNSTMCVLVEAKCFYGHPLVNKHDRGKSPFLLSNRKTHYFKFQWPFSIASFWHSQDG